MNKSGGIAEYSSDLSRRELGELWYGDAVYFHVVVIDDGYMPIMSVRHELSNMFGVRLSG